MEPSLLMCRERLVTLQSTGDSRLVPLTFSWRLLELRPVHSASAGGGLWVSSAFMCSSDVGLNAGSNMGWTWLTTDRASWSRSRCSSAVLDGARRWGARPQ